MKIAVVSIGSFDTQYSDYHIMRDIMPFGARSRGVLDSEAVFGYTSISAAV